MHFFVEHLKVHLHRVGVSRTGYPVQIFETGSDGFKNFGTGPGTDWTSFKIFGTDPGTS